jgi:hypothetical protein
VRAVARLPLTEGGLEPRRCEHLIFRHLVAGSLQGYSIEVTVNVVSRIGV